MRIALVGNGRVGLDGAREIDSYDLVVRLNRAKSLGFAGQRVDILVLARPKMAMSHDRYSAAYCAAKTVWSFSAENLSLLSASPVIQANPDWLVPALERLRS